MNLSNSLPKSLSIQRQPQINHFNRLPPTPLRGIMAALPETDRGILRATSRDMRTAFTMKNHLALCVSETVSHREQAIDLLRNATVVSINPSDASNNRRKVHYVQFSIKNDSGTEIYLLRAACCKASPEEAVLIAKASLNRIFRSASLISQRKQAILEAWTNTHTDKAITSFDFSKNQDESSIIRLVDTLSQAMEGGSVSINIIQFSDASDTHFGRQSNPNNVDLSLFLVSTADLVADYECRMGFQPEHDIEERTQRFLTIAQGRNLQEDQELLDDTIKNLHGLFKQQTDPLYRSNLLKQTITMLADRGINLDSDDCPFPRSLKEVSRLKYMIEDGRKYIEKHPRKFGITPLMQSVSRTFNMRFGSDIRDVTDAHLKKIQSLLSRQKNLKQIGRVDVFGRNAYHYIAKGSFMEYEQPGRAMMFDALRNNDSNFDQNIIRMDHMGETPLDSLIKEHNKKSFLTGSQLKALLHAQIKSHTV